MPLLRHSVPRRAIMPGSRISLFLPLKKININEISIETNNLCPRGKKSCGKLMFNLPRSSNNLGTW